MARRPLARSPTRSSKPSPNATATTSSPGTTTRLARTLANKAGVAELTGPLLITWPSSGAEGETARDPLIVDFSKANHERAAKALNYWFRQVKSRPDLWTSRIREGTIRAELADAVNDTAGVVLAVMAGKWDSLTVVASANASPL